VSFQLLLDDETGKNVAVRNAIDASCVAVGIIIIAGNASRLAQGH
jgi:hypothetical protein